jgi:UBX domain-containing protein 11
MATGLNKLGGNLWNAHNAHNQAAADKIKARIPLFKVEDERSMMERLMPSTAIPGKNNVSSSSSSSSSQSYNTSSLASQLQQNLREKSSSVSITSSSTTTNPATTTNNQQHSMRNHENHNNSNSGSFGGTSNNSNNNNNGKSESSLLTSMTSRLIALEKSHRKLRTEMVHKERQVLEWKRKYEAVVNAAEDDGIQKAAEKVQELQRANLILRGQVHEMESFLQDYGLIWVGSTSKTDESSLSENIGSRIDFTMLLRRLNELNVLAGEGKAKISKNGKNARFDFDPEKIPLAIFQDGLLIRRGPFRPFSDNSTQRFISDVLDGYFPPEFKNDYPDGVIFDIKNFSHECYINSNHDSNNNRNEGSPFKAFGGIGNRIGQQTKPMTREEFLNRLPEKIISKGRVIDIRSGIATKLNGDDGSIEEGKGNNESVMSKNRNKDDCPTSPVHQSQDSGIKIAQTPALTMLKRSATLGELHADEEVTTLRIKIPKGSTTTTSLLLKMYFSDTIGALRAHVASNIPPNIKEFDLRTSYPSKIFRDDSLTLLEAGLTPNAALIISITNTNSEGTKK